VKVSSTELPPRQVSLAIEVEQERLDLAIDDAYRRLAGRVDVPGFRRGKAPRSMVERMIGRDRIVEEALDQLLPQVVKEAIEQEKVDPYTRPRVESIEFDPLRLRAVVGLAPRVELGDYQAELHVENPSATVTEEQINVVVERIRGSYAQWAPVDRAVKPGDRVGLDLMATIDGREKPLLDSKEAEYVLDPEGAQPAPGFAEQLVDMEPGQQKSFGLTMPEDHREKDVAGQEAQFEVTLHWIKERELPALDDDFAQQVGDYADMTALRAAIETQLRTQEEQRVHAQLEEAAMSKLVEISSIEYPPQLVDHEAEHLMETFTRNVEQQGLKLPQYLRFIGKEQEAFEQEIRSEAEARVRRALALDAFATAEHIDKGAPDGGAEDASQRSQEVERERKAMARLLELAVRDGRNGSGAGDRNEKESTSSSEKAAEAAATSDTGVRSSDPPTPSAAGEAAPKEDRQSA
jgi:trigger factor